MPSRPSISFRRHVPAACFSLFVLAAGAARAGAPPSEAPPSQAPRAATAPLGAALAAAGREAQPAPSGIPEVPVPLAAPWRGSGLSLHVTGLTASDVLFYITSASGVLLAADPAVAGERVTMHVDGQQWDQILAAIAGEHGWHLGLRDGLLVLSPGSAPTGADVSALDAASSLVAFARRFPRGMPRTVRWALPALQSGKGDHEFTDQGLVVAGHDAAWRVDAFNRFFDRIDELQTK